MTISKEDRINLINYRMEQALESIETAELLIRYKKFSAAVNRIYYGLFYSVLALGLKHEFETSKHQQLIGWYNKNFVFEGKSDRKFGKILRKAYNKRTTGDYDAYTNFQKDEIELMVSEMKEFIDEIKRLLI